MQTRIDFLRTPGQLEQILRKDGWQLQAGSETVRNFKHPDVPDQDAARTRLYRLGLLTSGAVRVDFGPWA